jgi:polysaccharide biosynthesis transport protein
LLNQSIRTSNDIIKALNRHPLVVIPYITTQEEGRRKVGRLMLAAILALIFAVLGLLGVHFLYMPLDLVFAKILMRLNF